MSLAATPKNGNPKDRKKQVRRGERGWTELLLLFIFSEYLLNSHDRCTKIYRQFGGGSRACIGRNIAYLEIYKIIPQLLRTFGVIPPFPSRSKTH